MRRTFVLVPAALPVTCPACGAKISWEHASAHTQFLCPECRHGIHLRDRYFRTLYILSLVIAGLLAYLLGARTQSALFWSVVFGVLPVNFVVVNISLRLFPPDAELTGEYRGILYDPKDDGEDR